MVKIGNKPILSHIINIYLKHGFKNFILALGYKGYFIKDISKKIKRNIKKININLVETGRLTILEEDF